MKFGSLFAGIGGLDLGLEASGMECAWQVERDDYCRQVLEKHWPDVPRYKEVQDCGAHNLAPVELICGGFPCQPVSVAGARAGTDDERWLWPQFHRIICELRPRWVVAENVTGLLSANSGGAMGEVLGDLAASGYDAVWDIFPAGGPGGVGAPHRRERVFIIAMDDAHRDEHKRQGRRGGSTAGSLSAVNRTENGATGRVSGTGATLDGDPGEGYSAFFAKMAHADREGLQGCGTEHELREFEEEEQIGRGSRWAVEPSVGRVAYGVPARVDRLRCIGNAVVPQVARQIGELIINVQDYQGWFADT